MQKPFGTFRYCLGSKCPKSCCDGTLEIPVQDYERKGIEEVIADSGNNSPFSISLARRNAHMVLLNCLKNGCILGDKRPDSCKLFPIIPDSKLRENGELFIQLNIAGSVLCPQSKKVPRDSDFVNGVIHYLRERFGYDVELGFQMEDSH